MHMSLAIKFGINYINDSNYVQTQQQALSKFHDLLQPKTQRTFINQTKNNEPTKIKKKNSNLVQFRA